MHTRAVSPWMFVFLCTWLTAPLAAAAPQPRAAADDVAPKRLIQEIGERHELMKNLEELCDDIGPRVTGSAALRKAQAWAMDRLRSAGAVNVHEEVYDLGRPWFRGNARARLLNGNGQALDIVQWGWTEGTRGVVRGDVALVDVKTLAELEQVAPTLAGKVVLVVSRPRATDAERKDLKAYVSRLTKAWTHAGAALVLLPSEKDYGLQEMAGGPGSAYRSRTAFITREHANLLRRLLARGITPRVEAELGGRFGKQPVQASNVVADFPGTETNGEVVIVGAHLDSWDLGTGATDNGTGAVVAIEVLRAMHAAGLKPKRTLRVVLFSGEEQGLLGSKAYLAAHAAELEKLQAVLIQDSGAGRVTGYPDMKVDAWYTALTAAVGPAKELGVDGISYGIIEGSDQDPFFQRGIPAFAPLQETGDYLAHTHHSQVDAFDHVQQDDLVQCAQVMAVAAWGLLDGERLPHQAPGSDR